MEKTRWFANINEPSKAIEKRFGVPYNTARGWQKKQTTADYRGYLFDQLTLIIKLEENAILSIKKTFSNDELMALWGAFAKSTLYTLDLVEYPRALEYGFRDYCEYESVEAMQFLSEDETLGLFSKKVEEKLFLLSQFDKVVLLEYLKNNSEEIFMRTSLVYNL